MSHDSGSKKLPVKPGRASAGIIGKHRSSWPYLAVLLALVMIAVRIDQYFNIVYGNLGMLSLNRALSVENQQTQAFLADAQDKLANGLRKTPADSSYVFALGRAKLLQGDEQAAENTWSLADPHLAVNWLLLWGDIDRRQGQLAGARSWYEMAMRTAPQVADPWQRAGLLFELQKDLGAAQDAYEESLSKAVTYSIGRGDLYFRLAHLAVNGQEDPNWDTVLTLTEKALSGEKFSSSYNETQSHYLRAEALRQLGRNREAIDEYLMVLEQRPDDYWAHVHYGELLWQENSQLDSARAQLEEAILLQPSRKWAYRILADIMQESGNMVEAKALYEKVLEIDPQDNWSQIRLTDLREKRS